MQLLLYGNGSICFAHECRPQRLAMCRLRHFAPCSALASPQLAPVSHQGSAGAAECDEATVQEVDHATSQDLGNIVHFEHLNLEVRRASQALVMLALCMLPPAWNVIAAHHPKSSTCTKLMLHSQACPQPCRCQMWSWPGCSMHWVWACLLTRDPLPSSVAVQALSGTTAAASR